MSARQPAACGTDSGYYRHLRTTRTVPCEACLAAHAAANAAQHARKVAAGQARARKPGRQHQQYRLCADCGTRINEKSTRCASCAGRHRFDADVAFTGSWRLVKGVWKPVAA